MCYHIYIKQKTTGGFFTMPLITSKEMFKKAYEGKYAIGAFNVNNMEIIQGIVDAAKEEQAPQIGRAHV